MEDLILSLGEGLTPAECYDIKNNKSSIVLFKEVALPQYNAYIKALVDAGFTLYTENRIKGNRFATYITKEREVHLCFYPVFGELRVIGGVRGYLPETKAPDNTGDHPLTVSQMALASSDYEGGLSNVITLADGSFVIIDGGKKNDANNNELLEFLYAHKPADHEKPHITAWLISHAHHDHIHLCQEFLLQYGDRVELSLFGYNFPDLNSPWCKAEAAQLRWETRMIKILDEHFPNTKRWVMHTGQKLLLPGCEAEFLMTWEDFWPRPMKTTNQNSFCVRFTFKGGKTYLATCDAWQDLVEPMTEVYGDYLKSDVLQAIHHGLAGGSIPFYQRIAPKIVLWPTGKQRFEAQEPFTVLEREKPVAVIRQYKHSKWLLEHAEQHYPTGKTVTINMEDLSIL